MFFDIKSGGRYMEKMKKEIIEIIENNTSSEIIEYLHTFIKLVVEKWG